MQPFREGIYRIFPYLDGPKYVCILVQSSAINIFIVKLKLSLSKLDNFLENLYNISVF